ncbi:hypothetical protein NIES3275_27820 [Microchaete diplosiphon NIES-3275]|nr:hypothetical protein NIES3275_27820 [Microchaete diplosiphon NIES-3275]
MSVLPIVFAVERSPPAGNQYQCLWRRSTQTHSEHQQV